jgi:HD domain
VHPSLQTPDDARALLVAFGAPPRLITHTDLVLEATDLLLAKLRDMDVKVDAGFIRMAVILHDTGKIEHPTELSEPGAEHEPAGEKRLLAHGVDPALARCCLSHARWAEMPCSLEELCVALADNLWKGKRIEALEMAVIKAVAERQGLGLWDLFVDLDTAFEAIAGGGTKRLVRSMPG